MRTARTAIVLAGLLAGSAGCVGGDDDGGGDGSGEMPAAGSPAAGSPAPGAGTGGSSGEAGDDAQADASTPPAEVDAGAMDAGTPAADAGGAADAAPAVDGAISEGEEGWPCVSTIECGDGLTCVASVRFRVGFCARPCTGDAQCGDEICYSDTGDARDAHCVDLEPEQYGFCGEALTALCDNDRTCLTFPGEPFGVCVDICSVDGSDPMLATCEGEQTCISEVLNEPTAGVCGSEVGRGEECGIDIGVFCELGDLCTRSDPDDLEQPPLCHQSCSMGEACESGTCTTLIEDIAACL